MRRLWLIFAEFVTITLAIVFVVTLIRPDWSPARHNVVEIHESPGADGLTAVRSAQRITGFSAAAKKAMASVVNISTSKEPRYRAIIPFSTIRCCGAFSAFPTKPCNPR